MTDRQVLISAALGVGAICTTIVGSTCATNGRFNDLHADILDLRQEIRSEIRSVRDEIQSVRGEIQSVRDEIQSVRDEIQSVRDEIQSVRGLLIDHLDGHDRAGPGD